MIVIYHSFRNHVCINKEKELYTAKVETKVCALEVNRKDQRKSEGKRINLTVIVKE